MVSESFMHAILLSSHREGIVLDAAEFDQFADEYREMLRNVTGVTGEAPEYFAEYKIKELAEVVKRRKLQPSSILDFGSGTGSSIPYMRQFFPTATLTCADISQRSLDVAEERFPAMCTPLLMDSDSVPAADQSFNLLFTACVFHHIPHSEHQHWLRELLRVSRPGAVFTMFEHNPLNPLTTRAVRQCPFDENAVLIRAGEMARRFKKAGWKEPEVRYHLFFPNALSGLRRFEPAMAGIPLGAQYSVSAKK
jgi:ubiquinone/menaquinone biosynthesis C-methylase UbiE